MTKARAVSLAANKKTNFQHVTNKIKALILLLLTAGVFTMLALPQAVLAVSSEELAAVDLINSYRVKNGLNKLVVSDALSKAALGHSTDMANKYFFSHESLNGASFVDRISATGYTTHTYLGENIAAGMQTGEAVFEIWRKSPQHNEIMLGKNFKAIGIGRAYNANSSYGWYWTADFGGYVDSTGSNSAEDNTGNSTGKDTNDNTDNDTSIDNDSGDAGNNISTGNNTNNNTDTNKNVDNKTGNNTNTSSNNSTGGKTDNNSSNNNSTGGKTDNKTSKNSNNSTNKNTGTSNNSPGIDSGADNIKSKDVDIVNDTGVWGHENLEWLVDNKGLVGYPDGTLKPGNDITRGELAVMIVKTLEINPKGRTVFKDSLNHWARSYIAALADRKIFVGYVDGKFKPDKPVTRAELTQVITRAAGLHLSKSEKPFADIEGHWAQGTILIAASNDVVKGYADGKFRPDISCTRAEAATILRRLAE